MVMELSRQLVLPRPEQLHNIEHVHATVARLVVHHRHHGLVGTLGTVIRRGILLKGKLHLAVGVRTAPQLASHDGRGKITGGDKLF